MEGINNSVNMHIKRIQWMSDCLIFYFGTLKENKTGERAIDTWHVYPKPKNSTIFPVLSLAKYLISNPYILTTNYPLYPDNCQYNRFLKIFHKVIKDNFDRFQLLGVEKVILGAHSIRKGAITIFATA